MTEQSAEHHLLVVDDEPDLRLSIHDYFSAHGFTVLEAGDGNDMRTIMSDHPVDVVLLDLRLPGEDGFALCRHLRANHSVGIIMLTGSADTVDKVVGLEMGADDYVSKPFELRELLARVKSVLRRVGTPAPVAKEPGAGEAEDSIQIGAFTLNLRSHTLNALDGQPVPITSMEFDLLVAFARRPNRVLSRDQLLEVAHDKDWEPFDRSIDVRITRLRKKIEEDPAKPRLIRTVRGAGYMYCPAS